MYNILTVTNLVKKYKKVPVLSDINTEINEGSIVGLTGPSGCGKSTFLRVVAGLSADYSGEITLFEQKPDINSKRLISYLPQADFLIKWKTVGKMLDYVGDFFEDFRRDNAVYMLENLGISQKRKIKKLSKSENKLLRIAIAISRDVKLYLLDEPFSDVEKEYIDFLKNAILENCSLSSAVIIAERSTVYSEHLLSSFIFMDKGSFLMQDTMGALRERDKRRLDDVLQEVIENVTQPV